MRKLIIRNVGPINNADIDLNKVNVFIGPQSSGKSTITKIACYCSWVEKKIALLNANEELLSKENTFSKELIQFHKLAGYLGPDSYIYYESNILTIEYTHSEKKPIFRWKDRFSYKKGKISYIPSERNIVAAIPNWINIEFIDNNIRSFMSDWDKARRTHRKESPLDILNIGVKYFFDGTNDKVIINQAKKTLELTDTSSGLQSTIPLLVLLDYIYIWMYDNEIPESIKDLEEQNALDMELMEEAFNTSNFVEIFELLQERDRILADSTKNTKGVFGKFDRFKLLRENFGKIHYTNVYLEEPEQNLFPETQYHLIRELVRLNNLNEDHTLTITTHSPYILSAINNLIYANQIGCEKEQMVETIIEKDCWVDYDTVRAYFVDGGSIYPILDDEIKQIKAEAIDGASVKINEEYETLLKMEDFNDI